MSVPACEPQHDDERASGRNRGISPWYAAAAATVLAVVVLTAMSADVYGATLPASLPHHTILRKLYALGAFALAGGVLAPIFDARARKLKVAIAIGMLSVAIEIGQRLLGSGEWWRWMTFDVASGVVGGYVGALVQGTLATLALHRSLGASARSRRSRFR